MAGRRGCIWGGSGFGSGLLWGKFGGARCFEGLPAESSGNRTVVRKSSEKSDKIGRCRPVLRRKLLMYKRPIFDPTPFRPILAWRKEATDTKPGWVGSEIKIW